MEYQKITNLLGSTSDKVPRFITKKWIEAHDQSCTAENRYNPNKQIRFKTSILRSDLCKKLFVTKPNNNAYDKKLYFKVMRHSFPAFQKLIIHLLIMQKT